MKAFFIQFGAHEGSMFRNASKIDFFLKAAYGSSKMHGQGSFSETYLNRIIAFQVDANDNIVVGVSSDSTVCVWSRSSGELRGNFHLISSLKL